MNYALKKFLKFLFVFFTQAAELRQIIVGIFQFAQNAGERLVLAGAGRIRIPVVATEDFTRLFIMEINDFHWNSMLQRGLVSKNADGRHVNRLIHIDIDRTVAADRLREEIIREEIAAAMTEAAGIRKFLRKLWIVEFCFRLVARPIQMHATDTQLAVPLIPFHRAAVAADAETVAMIA